MSWRFLSLEPFTVVIMKKKTLKKNGRLKPVYKCQNWGRNGHPKVKTRVWKWACVIWIGVAGIDYRHARWSRHNPFSLWHTCLTHFQVIGSWPSYKSIWFPLMQCTVGCVGAIHHRPTAYHRCTSALCDQQNSEGKWSILWFLVYQTYVYECR